MDQNQICLTLEIKLVVHLMISTRQKTKRDRKQKLIAVIRVMFGY